MQYTPIIALLMARGTNMPLFSNVELHRRKARELAPAATACLAYSCPACAPLQWQTAQSQQSMVAGKHARMDCIAPVMGTQIIAAQCASCSAVHIMQCCTARVPIIQ